MPAAAAACADRAAARAALLAAVARGRAAGPPEARSAPAADAAARPHPRCLRDLHVEDLWYRSDDSPQGWVPLRLVQCPPADGAAGRRRLPVIILLHPTGSGLQHLAAGQAEYARRGYLTAAIDTRYHGCVSTW